VQGNAGAPFLGIGQTGLAGPPGATGVRGVAGGVTIAGDPHGVVVGATNNNIGLASSNVTYSQSVAVNNSTLNVNGNMAPNLLLWTKSAFGVPQTGTASGTNSSAPVPSGNLLTLSLNIVNADTGYSLMDAPAVLFIANMSTSNTLVNPISSDPYTPTIINSTNFYMNGKYAGRIIQFPANRINPAVKLWQTRQFFTILYRGVDYGPGLSSNAYFFCQTQTATGIDSSQTALGAWNLYMSVAGLYQ
jgi:hypothetical protein